MTPTRDHRLRVGAHYDALADYGPYAAQAPRDRGGRKSRYIAAVFDAAILPHLRDGAPFHRLLDFGCGTGIFAVQAQNFGDQVVGIDISWAMLRRTHQWAEERGANIGLAMSDGTRLPFADGSFDRFVARESLCYIPDEQLGAVVSEIGRVMGSGAKIYVLDQVSENPTWQFNMHAPNLKKRSINEILTAFNRSGFVLEEAIAVRQPRFLWIYLVWLGLVPVSIIRFLAKAEVAWNRRFCCLRTRRWQNVLFVFHKS